jgi:formylglycine-generating enzyme required for sulfatase activity
MLNQDNFYSIIGDVYKDLYLTIILIALILLIKADYLEVYIKNKLKVFFDLLININFKKKNNLIALFILFLFVMLLVPFINQYKTTESTKIISNIKILEPKMIKITGGSFLMGSTEVEINSVKPEGSESLIRYKEKIKDELKQRNISLKDFEISETEITIGQFKQFVNQSKIKINNNCSSFDYSKRKTAGDIDYVNWENPGFEQTDNHPVTCITWQEAQEYIKWLNQNTGKKYRLLSEAEWEYVAKAGCTSQYNIAGQCKEKIEPSQANFDGRIQFNGSQISDLKRVGTQAVGSYQPNQMNVYDMHGNIAEFVEDCHEINYLRQQPTDGSAHRVNDCQFSHRVSRGGSWNDAPYRLRANYRSSTFYSNNATGFRLARSLP